MKILLFGRGVIATQYGWAFDKAGHQVEFYVRPGKKAQLGQDVRLRIYDGRSSFRGVLVQETWNTRLTEELRSGYDLILVSVQHYQLQPVIDLLADKIGSATVLLFNNVWDEPQQVAAKLPSRQLVWGFPTAGGGYDQQGTLNGSLLKGVTIGTLGEGEKSRQQAVTELFHSAGFGVKISPDFRSYLFGHFALNAALHREILKGGQDLAASLNVLQTSLFWRNVQLNLQELIPVLKARGVDLKASPDLKLLSVPPGLLSLVMRIALRFFPVVKQIFLAHANPVELQSYGKDVVATAAGLNINLPRLSSTGALG